LLALSARAPFRLCGTRPLHTSFHSVARLQQRARPAWGGHSQNACDLRQFVAVRAVPPLLTPLACWVSPVLLQCRVDSPSGDAGASRCRATSASWAKAPFVGALYPARSHSAESVSKTIPYPRLLSALSPVRPLARWTRVGPRPCVLLLSRSKSSSTVPCRNRTTTPAFYPGFSSADARTTTAPQASVRGLLRGILLRARRTPLSVSKPRARYVPRLPVRGGAPAPGWAGAWPPRSSLAFQPAAHYAFARTCYSHSWPRSTPAHYTRPPGYHRGPCLPYQSYIYIQSDHCNIDQ